MEIEAKFRVEQPETFHALLALPTLGPFVFEQDSHIERQHNTYFDTADTRLRSQKYGLRIRDLGNNRRIATLKGNAQERDGLYERDEWEAPIGAADHPAQWPPSEVRERALALLDGAELLPILTIATDRQHVYALRQHERVAEISLDQGTIYAGGRQEVFRELEIELLPNASRADFDSLVETLRQRLALVPESRSKLARGLMLLQQGKG